MNIFLRTYILLVISMLSLTSVFGQKNVNLKEYQRTIYNLEKTIWSLKGYIIDTGSIYWTATDPTGFFSFESERYDGGVKQGYNIKLRSFIYSEDYFTRNQNIESTYYIDGQKREKLLLNTDPELIDSELPFNMDEIKVIYFEKNIYLYPSDKIVFNRMNFEAYYIVFFKDNSKKIYVVNSITHKLEEGSVSK